MQIQPRITLLDVPQSQAIETDIRDKIEKLETFYPHMTRCDVVIKQEQKHTHTGKLYRPRITVSVPGEKINVNHACNEDVYVALRDAFSATRRRLQEYSCRQHGNIKHHELPLRGRILRIFPEEEFGFIEAQEDEYYFNVFNVTNANFDLLKPGMTVDFIAANDADGYQAKRVKLIKKHKTK